MAPASAVCGELGLPSLERGLGCPQSTESRSVGGAAARTDAEMLHAEVRVDEV